MPLMPASFAKATTDHIARIVEEWAQLIGLSTDLELITGVSMQARANVLENESVAANDYDIEGDFNKAFRTVAENISVTAMWGVTFPLTVSQYDAHCQDQGDTVDSTIVSLATYLDYYGLTADVPNYSLMIDPWFQDLWNFLSGELLPVQSVNPKPIHPDWRGTAYTSANAMGSIAWGGAFVDGYAGPDDYGCVKLVVEVTTDFAGGASAPSFTVTGLDYNSDAQTWTGGATGATNPVSAVATTITPAVVGMTRSTVAVASTTGVVAGSVMKVNAGLVDEEVILVEATGAGPTITAVFRKDHLAGAALTGKYSYILTSVGAPGSRAFDVNGFTFGATGHASGAVRVIGVPDRIAV